MNELFHYGTKGQKWGERRYQNKDGTWTELGKERRRQTTTKKYINPDGTLTDKGRIVFKKKLNKLLEDKWYPEGLEYKLVDVNRGYDTSGIIPKNTKSYRKSYDDKEHPTDTNRKYVSFNRDGFFEFYDNPDSLSFLRDDVNYSKDRTFVYKTKKDLKLVKSSEVDEYLTHLVSRVSNRNKKLIEDLKYVGLQDIPIFRQTPNWTAYKKVKNMDPIEKRAYEWFTEYSKSLKRQQTDRLMATKPDEENPVFKYFMDKGYDAMSDIEDSGTGSPTGATIIFNPKKSLKLHTTLEYR